MTGRSLVHALRYLAGMDEAHSQTTARERSVLREWCAGRRRGVEIGVHEGVTTCLIAGEMADDGRLYAIDPFYAGRLGICWTKLVATAMIRRAGVASRVELVETVSHEAAKRIDGEFDFVFVDGDHSSDGIANDWRDWSGRVQAGGVIALHDTLPPKAESSDVLGSVAFFESTIRRDDRFELVAQADTLSVLRRKLDGGEARSDG